MADPWAFGWNQLLTCFGLIVTGGIAICGFRTFDSWKREKIEERRIDIALDALSISYESKTVFGRIRNPNGFEGEWAQMPIRKGESPEHRASRGASYAILVRLNRESGFFDRVARLRPKAIAMFGARAEMAFERLENARAWIEDAANQLTWQIPVVPPVRSQEDFDMRMRLRGDMWAGFAEQRDRVEDELGTFRSEMEVIFKPIIAKWTGGSTAT